MAKKKVLSSDLIWMFHEKLGEYEDNPFHGIALAIIGDDNGDWEVTTQKKLPSRIVRNPGLATRISAIEKQLRKQYTLAAD